MEGEVKSGAEEKEDEDWEKEGEHGGEGKTEIAEEVGAE